MDSARALIARGWGVSLVSRCLRVSRAQLHVILRRTDDWKDGRRSRHSDDTDVLLRIHHVIGELPTYGYRRVSISKLALENGINANLLFKWRQQWREGKLLLPSSESPQLLPVTLDAAAEQPESLAEDPKTLSISCEVTFRHGTLRFNGNVSEKLLTLLIQELKR